MALAVMTFQWEFSPDAEKRGIGEFSLGDLTVSGPRATMTTRGQVPRQSMMLFPTISGLLDALVAYLPRKDKKSFSYNSVGSSFTLSLVPTKDGNYTVKAAGTEVGTVTERELISAIWDSVQSFLARHRSQAGSVAMDMEDAEADFKEKFGIP